MAQWKRVLLSGSHFDVRALTISEVPYVTGGERILFAATASGDDAGGAFKQGSTFKVDPSTTASISGNLGYTGGSTSFEGDGSDITGITSANTEFGLLPGAGLGFISNGGANGAFNGGSALKAVVALKGSSNFGTSTAYFSETLISTLNAGVDGGIVYSAIANSQAALSLDPTLPGNGLEWADAALNNGRYDELRIDRDGSTNAAHGLELGSSGIRLASSVAGGGLVFTGTRTSLNIDLADNGLTVTDGIMGTGKLALNANLAGTGLSFPSANDRSALSVDTGSAASNTGNAVGATNRIFIRPGYPSLGGIWANSLGGGQGADSLGYGGVGIGFDDNLGSINYTVFSGEQRQNFIDNPEYHFDINTYFGVDDNNSEGAEVNFTGSVTIEGNLTIVSSSNVASLKVDKFETSDQFILLNSGSEDTSPAFQYNNGGIIVNTKNTDGGSGSAFFYQSGSDSTIWGVTVENEVSWDALNPGITDGGISNSTTIAAISTVTYATGDDPNSFQDSTPELLGYDWEKQERRGTWYIDENSGGLGAESNVWLFVADQGDGGGGGGK